MSEGWIPPAHSSLSNAAEEIQLLASTTDDGDRDMNNLLGDDNNQRLSSLSERLSGLGKFVIEVFVSPLQSYPMQHLHHRLDQT